ncbi:hypothetical protein KFL_002280120 [Klebsormidium nitens]|uniref:Bifunctional inhibitor/plant lipid transfer protein/seed storage helical domain-containing protein n=1 Tax=Klebsormidium nitens TaxID=105231 RepID=A0A1Y1IB20_KLENI|nr:hypothetical protein KFL_002280120 [Klebsormidium nitens]|eukprot:GAQ85298.1 hypothetical protein KFL_002280120 [Klebsormidium nitens]
MVNERFLYLLTWVVLVGLMISDLSSRRHPAPAKAGLVALSVPPTRDCEQRLKMITACHVAGQACCHVFQEANARGCFCYLANFSVEGAMSLTSADVAALASTCAVPYVSVPGADTCPSAPRSRFPAAHLEIVILFGYVRTPALGARIHTFLAPVTSRFARGVWSEVGIGPGRGLGDPSGGPFAGHTAQRSARGMLPGPEAELRTSLLESALWSLPRGPFLNGKKQFETSAEQSMVLSSGAVRRKDVGEKAVLPILPEQDSVAGEGSRADEERKERKRRLATGSFVGGADLLISDESGSSGGTVSSERNGVWHKGTFHAADNRDVRLRKKRSPSNEADFDVATVEALIRSEFLGDVLPERDVSTTKSPDSAKTELCTGGDSARFARSARSAEPLGGGKMDTLPDLSSPSARDGGNERIDREPNELQHGPFTVKDKGPSADELDWAYFASVRQLQQYRQHTDAFLARQGSVPDAQESGSGRQTDGSGRPEPAEEPTVDDEDSQIARDPRLERLSNGPVAALRAQSSARASSTDLLPNLLSDKKQPGRSSRLPWIAQVDSNFPSDLPLLKPTSAQKSPLLIALNAPEDSPSPPETAPPPPEFFPPLVPEPPPPAPGTEPPPSSSPGNQSPLPHLELHPQLLRPFRPPLRARNPLPRVRIPLPRVGTPLLQRESLLPRPPLRLPRLRRLLLELVGLIHCPYGKS